MAFAKIEQMATKGVHRAGLQRCGVLGVDQRPEPDRRRIEGPAASWAGRREQRAMKHHAPARGLLFKLVALAGLVLLAMPAFAGDTVYYYLSDSLHSEVVVTDANRNVVETTHYAPYGQVLDRTLRDGPGYAAAAEDPATGLNYMQQRYYDPQTGRFLSTDPMTVTPDGADFNRYEYAKDNPYRYTDPTGMCSTGTHIASGESCEGLGVSVTLGLGSTLTTVKQAAHRQAQHMQQYQPTTGQRVFGAVMSGTFGTALDAMKRPSNPTYVPLKLSHELYMTGGSAVIAAESPYAVALGASALPVVPEAAGAAGRVVAQHAPRAAMMACLGLAICSGHGQELPEQYAHDEEMIPEVARKEAAVAEDYIKTIFESNKNGQ